MEKYDFIIIGAGLAGLTTAWKLNDLFPESSIALIECKRVGGQCVSVKSHGVSFDVGGHFCHNFELLPAVFDEFYKKCDSFEKNTYSFDVNWNCYKGMIQDSIAPKASPVVDSSCLEKFLLTRFGKDLYHLFFKSYNEKLNVIPLDQCKVVQSANARTPDKGKKVIINHSVIPNQAAFKH